MLEFIVELGYKNFRFTNKNDAIIFAEIAKLHSLDDKMNVEVLVNWIDDPEPEQDQQESDV